MELRQGSVVHFLLLLRGGGETPFFFFLFFLFSFPTPDNAKVPLLPGSIGHSSSFQAAPPPLSRQKGETFSTDNEPHFFSRREKFEPPLNRNTIARIREIATTPSFHRLRSARDNSRAFHTGAHSLSLSLPLSGRSCETPTLHVDSKRRPERSGQTEVSSRARTRVDGRIGRNWTFERIDDRVLSCLPGFSRERPSPPRGK